MIHARCGGVLVEEWQPRTLGFERRLERRAGRSVVDRPSWVNTPERMARCGKCELVGVAYPRERVSRVWNYRDE